MDFKQKMQTYADMTNEALLAYIKEKDTPERDIYKAMLYSLMAGGKRLRPVLTLAVCEMLKGQASDVMPYACALEMIHTYSLIHDDLPAMDNDDYRRGRLTNHRVFGEGLAILAGDALLTYALEIVALDVQRSASTSGDYTQSGDVAAKARAMVLIAQAAGTSGMIGGQVVDMQAEGKSIEGTLLEYMHACKTGAMIHASVMVSALLCHASSEQHACLETFSKKLGLAFQIKDDILDVEGSLEAMGKPVGSDANNQKTTFVTLYGIEKSKKMLQNTTQEALSALGCFGEDATFLKALSAYLVERNH